MASLGLSACLKEMDSEEESTMNGITNAVSALRQASRNMADKWREYTFGGMVRIEFPVAVSNSQETLVENERARTRVLLQSIRSRAAQKSALSQL